MAPRLIQEFVKVRKDDERGREAMIAALVCRSFSKRAIVFYEVRSTSFKTVVAFLLIMRRIVMLVFET